MKKTNVKRLVGIIAFVAIIGFSMAVCNSIGGGRKSNNAEMEEIIVCLGDSLTAGAGATVAGQDDKSKSWPAFFQNKVNIPVINAGVSGDTTAQGLARVNRDVLSKNPKIVIIVLGINDASRNIPLATTRRNLKKIIDMVNDGSRKVYLARWPPTYTWNGRYDNMYNRLASSNNIELIDGFMEGVLETHHLEGDFHPNAEGYEIIANNIFNSLKPYLEANNLIF